MSSGYHPTGLIRWSFNAWNFHKLPAFMELLVSFPHLVTAQGKIMPCKQDANHQASLKELTAKTCCQKPWWFVSGLGEASLWSGQWLRCSFWMPCWKRASMGIPSSSEYNIFPCSCNLSCTFYSSEVLCPGSVALFQVGPALAEHLEWLLEQRFDQVQQMHQNVVAKRPLRPRNFMFFFHVFELLLDVTCVFFWRCGCLRHFLWLLVIVMFHPDNIWRENQRCKPFGNPSWQWTIQGDSILYNSL